MELILDTTILIDAERQKVTLDKVVDNQDTVSISAVTYAELLHGVEMANDRTRASRQAFVEAVAQRVPVLAYDQRVARTHAGLLAATQRSGRPRGAHDLIIAATAATLGLTVVTSDPDGFTQLPGVDVRGREPDSFGA
ncbi:tRNA(fMet)-specific endonuclease VapC [soil metagenome]